MKKTLGALLILAGTAAPLSIRAAEERWIHVRVDDAGDSRARVDLQVPIELVSTLLPALDGGHGSHKISIDGSDLDLKSLRSSWASLREARDGEYVTVKDDDSEVRISKSHGVFLVTVTGEGGREHVRMKLPVSLVDAALSGGDSIDLPTIASALAKVPSGDLITVDDDDSHVRIWIDGQAAPVRENAR